MAVAALVIVLACGFRQVFVNEALRAGIFTTIEVVTSDDSYPRFRSSLVKAKLPSHLNGYNKWIKQAKFIYNMTELECFSCPFKVAETDQFGQIYLG